VNCSEKTHEHTINAEAGKGRKAIEKASLNTDLIKTK